jgi:hypothetical protein
LISLIVITLLLSFLVLEFLLQFECPLPSRSGALKREVNAHLLAEDIILFMW